MNCGVYSQLFDALDVGLLIVWALVLAGCIFVKKNFRPGINPFVDAEFQVNQDDIYMKEPFIFMPNADASDSDHLIMRSLLQENTPEPIKQEILANPIESTEAKYSITAKSPDNDNHAVKTSFENIYSEEFLRIREQINKQFESLLK